MNRLPRKINFKSWSEENDKTSSVEKIVIFKSVKEGRLPERDRQRCFKFSSSSSSSSFLRERCSISAKINQLLPNRKSKGRIGMENRIEQGNKSRISRQRLTDFGILVGVAAFLDATPFLNTVAKWIRLIKLSNKLTPSCCHPPRAIHHCSVHRRASSAAS